MSDLLEPPRGHLPASPECPFCRERQTELISAFGSQASVSTYWCRRCRTGFEFIRWGVAEGAGNGREG